MFKEYSQAILPMIQWITWYVATTIRSHLCIWRQDSAYKRWMNNRTNYRRVLVNRGRAQGIILRNVLNRAQSRPTTSYAAALNWQISFAVLVMCGYLTISIGWIVLTIWAILGTAILDPVSTMWNQCQAGNCKEYVRNMPNMTAAPTGSTIWIMRLYIASRHNIITRALMSLLILLGASWFTIGTLSQIDTLMGLMAQVNQTRRVWTMQDYGAVEQFVLDEEVAQVLQDGFPEIMRNIRIDQATVGQVDAMSLLMTYANPNTNSLLITEYLSRLTLKVGPDDSALFDSHLRRYAPLYLRATNGARIRQLQQIMDHMMRRPGYMTTPLILPIPVVEQIQELPTDQPVAAIQAEQPVGSLRHRTPVQST